MKAKRLLKILSDHQVTVKQTFREFGFVQYIATINGYSLKFALNEIGCVCKLRFQKPWGLKFKSLGRATVANICNWLEIAKGGRWQYSQGNKTILISLLASEDHMFIQLRRSLLVDIIENQEAVEIAKEIANYRLPLGILIDWLKDHKYIS